MGLKNTKKTSTEIIEQVFNDIVAIFEPEKNTNEFQERIRSWFNKELEHIGYNVNEIEKETMAEYSLALLENQCLQILESVKNNGGLQLNLSWGEKPAIELWARQQATHREKKYSGCNNSLIHNYDRFMQEAESARKFLIINKNRLINKGCVEGHMSFKGSDVFDELVNYNIFDNSLTTKNNIKLLREHLFEIKIAALTLVISKKELDNLQHTFNKLIKDHLENEDLSQIIKYENENLDSELQLQLYPIYHLLTTSLYALKGKREKIQLEGREQVFNEQEFRKKFYKQSNVPEYHVVLNVLSKSIDEVEVDQVAQNKLTLKDKTWIVKFQDQEFFINDSVAIKTLVLIIKSGKEGVSPKKIDYEISLNKDSKGSFFEAEFVQRIHIKNDNVEPDTREQRKNYRELEETIYSLEEKEKKDELSNEESMKLSNARTFKKKHTYKGKVKPLTPPKDIKKISKRLSDLSKMLVAQKQTDFSKHINENIKCKNGCFMYLSDKIWKISRQK